MSGDDEEKSLLGAGRRAINVLMRDVNNSEEQEGLLFFLFFVFLSLFLFFLFFPLFSFNLSYLFHFYSFLFFFIHFYSYFDNSNAFGPSNRGSSTATREL